MGPAPRRPAYELAEQLRVGFRPARSYHATPGSRLTVGGPKSAVSSPIARVRIAPMLVRRTNASTSYARTTASRERQALSKGTPGVPEGPTRIEDSLLRSGPCAM
jgi:hypothetical protein